jgi:membrane protein DedA with SNARE-associated domain/membrane-associated phospholipid phosphatase
MTDIASPIFQWLNAHPELAGLATFIISAAESVAIIGTIVPGSVMMTAIGALTGAGIIPFWPTMIWAILGAIVGDGISYWVGYRFKNQINNVWPFRTHPQLLDSGKTFFTRHGGMSVFIGRFVGPVRALVPLVAGMLGVRPLRFTLANIISAIGWAPAYLLPGIILGAASVELPSEVATRVILMLLLTGLLIILCVWLIKETYSLIQKEIDQALTRLWKKLEGSRYFHLIAAALQHHDKTRTHGQLTLGFYFLLTGTGLLYLLSFVLYHGPQNILINTIVFHLFRTLRSPAFDNIMLFITFLGEKYVLLPLSVTLFIWLAGRKRFHTAWHVLGLGVMTAGAIEIAKELTRIERPWGVLDNTVTSHFSFPSGHITLAIVFYMGMALLISRTFKHPPRRCIRYTVHTMAWLFIIAVILSRLYFGIHWLTDILGSILLGIAILMLFILSYNRKEEQPIAPKGMILTIVVTLFAAYAINTTLTFKSIKRDYTLVEWPVRTVSYHDWWAQQGEHFPAYRVNRIGSAVKVFNVQWLGNLSGIEKVLLKNGWQPVRSHDWLRVLYRITGVESTTHLPLVPPIYLDKPPVVVFTKPVGHKLLVLRFWNSYMVIKNNPLPLWMGSIEYAPNTYSWLFKRKRNQDINLTPELLLTTTPHPYHIKETTVTTRIKQHTVNQPIILIKPKTKE